jgi:hypothetical protein
LHDENIIEKQVLRREEGSLYTCLVAKPLIVPAETGVPTSVALSLIGVPAKWFFIRCTHLLPTSFSAFQMSVARRLNFRSTQRIRGRTKGCPILLLCTFTAEVTLRSSVPAFQRNHRKRLAPFFWNPPGFTCVHPHSLTFAPLARASLITRSAHTHYYSLHYVPLNDAHSVLSMTLRYAHSIRPLRSLLLATLRSTQ